MEAYKYALEKKEREEKAYTDERVEELTLDLEDNLFRVMGYYEFRDSTDEDFRQAFNQGFRDTDIEQLDELSTSFNEEYLSDFDLIEDLWVECLEGALSRHNYCKKKARVMTKKFLAPLEKITNEYEGVA